MKKYVITILDNPHSVEASERCIESAKKFGYDVEVFPAITPADDPMKIFEEEGLPTAEFLDNMYSRTEPTMSCFLSHYYLWKKEEDLLVLEHDAVFIEPLPDIEIHGVTSFGKPSYGHYNTPRSKGLYGLFSKPGGYMPGAHAYAVTKDASKVLVKQAKKTAQPTDLYLNSGTFPRIKEYYPWPVVVDDRVSTVQKELGCKAKHNSVVPV